MKKNEILPFATTRMDLEGVMLRAISQRKTNTVISLVCGIVKQKFMGAESRLEDARGGGYRLNGDGGRRSKEKHFQL